MVVDVHRGATEQARGQRSQKRIGGNSEPPACLTGGASGLSRCRGGSSCDEVVGKTITKQQWDMLRRISGPPTIS